jgi:hypothetical protein
MKNFIVNLFSNRFGIVLAAVNVCYFATKSQNMADVPQTFIGKAFISMNVPAFISTRLCYEIGKAFLGEFANPVLSVKLFLFASFIVLQWLFIGWVAKTLAAKIRLAKLQ